MSRWTDSLAGHRRGDGGFTLVEVIVALGVLMLVSTALLPQLVVGIQSTGVARDVTQTKGVGQGEIERMRNLPFHISREAGQYVDVLDRYYPNVSKTPGGLTCTGAGEDIPLSTAATGFVPSTGARCGYEPTAGNAFFRTVSSRPATGDMGGYTIVVDAQFLSDATPPVPVAPAAGYDSQITGRDNPPASQLGVTVTVFSDRPSAGRPVVTYTQIASQPPASTRLRGRVAVRALEIGTVVLDPVTDEKLLLSLSAGLLNIAGSVSTASKMTVSRAAVSPTLAGDDSTPDWLSAVQIAPPDGTTPLLTPHAGALSQGCAYACWGGSTLNSVMLSASDGRPNAGSSGQPVRSELTDATHHGVRFGNAPDPSGYVAALGLTGNLVELDTATTRRPPTATTACEPTGSSVVSGAGFVTSTVTDVVTCASASSTVVELFHSEQAPDGIVRLELVSATVSCRVQGVTHTASVSHDYRLFVEYWDNVAEEYQTVGPITKATQSDLLAAVDLSTVQVGGGKLLGDYISSWSSVTPERVKQTQVDGVAEVDIPGVASISTQPTRADPSLPEGDTPSVVSLTLGALSCYAEDRR